MQCKILQPFSIRSSVLFAAALFVWVTATADAATEDITDKLNKIKREIKTTEKLKTVKEKQRIILQRQIQNLAAEERTLEEKVKKTTEELTALTDEIERLRDAIAAQDTAITAQKKLLSQLLRLQYEHRANTTLASTLSIPRELRHADYTTQTQKRVRETVERIRRLRDKMIRDREQLSQKKSDVEKTRQKLKQRTDYLESTRAYKAYLANKTARDISAFQKKIQTLREQEIELRREIERIEAAKLDSANLANLPSRRAADLRYPVKRVILTQGYGYTTFGKTAKYRGGFHNGIDLAGGGKIYAAADGKVVARGDMGRYGYGKWVAIDHGNGLVTLYGHMKKVTVKRGKSVDKGDTIGIMGTTGYSTGVHVHFTVFAADSFEVVSSSRVRGLLIPTGASVNPMIYL